MPRVNIYIRNEDWEKWRAIDDVPTFLKHAIANHNFSVPLVAIESYENGKLKEYRVEVDKTKPIMDATVPTSSRVYDTTTTTECPRHHMSKADCANLHV